MLKQILCISTLLCTTFSQNVTHDSSCSKYSYYNAKEDFDRAQKLCHDQNMTVVVIETPEEIQNVQDFIQNVTSDAGPTHIWLGLMYDATIDVWRKPDQSQAFYFKWDEVQYSTSRGFTRACLDLDRFEFNTAHFGEATYPVLCETTANNRCIGRSSTSATFTATKFPIQETVSTFEYIISRQTETPILQVTSVQMQSKPIMNEEKKEDPDEDPALVIVVTVVCVVVAIASLTATLCCLSKHWPVIISVFHKTKTRKVGEAETDN